MTPRLAFLYSRVSSPEQLRGGGIARQRSLAEDFCRRHGWTLDSRSYNDLGLSAFKGLNVQSGELAAFIKAVEQGTIPRDSVLLAESHDRLSRQKPVLALDAFRKVLALGVTVCTMSDGKVFTEASLDDVGDLLTSIITMARAFDESKHKQMRLTASWSQRRSKARDSGRVMTAQCPSWLTPKSDRSGFEVIPEKAKVVEKVFAVALEGKGIQATTAALNKQRVPTIGTSGRWNTAYVAKLLSHPAVIGDFIGSDSREQIEDYFPSIIPKAAWLKVQEMRKGRMLPPGPRTGRDGSSTGTPNVFSGLLKCSTCGASMHFVNKGKAKGGAYLTCANVRLGDKARCTASSIRYSVFEHKTIEAIYKHLDWRKIEPSLRSALSSQVHEDEERLASITVEQESIRARLGRLLDALEQGGESSATVLARIKDLEQKQTALASESLTLTQRLASERERLAGVREEVRGAWTACQKFLDHPHDHERRARLAMMLREKVKVVRVGWTVDADDEGDGGPEGYDVEVAFVDDRAMTRLNLVVMPPLAK